MEPDDVAWVAFDPASPTSTATVFTAGDWDGLQQLGQLAESAASTAEAFVNLGDAAETMRAATFLTQEERFVGRVLGHELVNDGTCSCGQQVPALGFASHVRAMIEQAEAMLE